MDLFAQLQQKFGFTKNEIRVILFLSIALICGLGIRWYRGVAASPAGTEESGFDYAHQDSEFVAGARALDSIITSGIPEPRGVPLTSGDSLSAGEINLNTATSEDLIRLPGIGPRIAERILEYRTKNGPFSSIDALRNVKGIGPKKLKKIRPYLRVK